MLIEWDIYNAANVGRDFKFTLLKGTDLGASELSNKVEKLGDDILTRPRLRGTANGVPFIIRGQQNHRETNIGIVL